MKTIEVRVTMKTIEVVQAKLAEFLDTVQEDLGLSEFQVFMCVVQCMGHWARYGGLHPSDVTKAFCDAYQAAEKHEGKG